MNKIVIEHNKPKPKKVTIKDLCFRKFNDGFTVNEIVKSYGHKLGIVQYYRKRYASEQAYKMSRYQSLMTTESKNPYSRSEMDYGSEIPTYKWEGLDPVEKILYRHFKHKQLRKF
jgi:hypothetical protein